MKPIITTLLLMTTSISLFAQNLSMSELISLVDKDVASVEEFLLHKNWLIIEANDREIEVGISKKISVERLYSNIIFEYYSNPDFTLSCSYDSDNIVREVSVSPPTHNKYIEYLNAIKSYGCKLVHQSANIGGIWKIYQGKTKTFTISVTYAKNMSGEPISMWNIEVCSNETFSKLVEFFNEKARVREVE